MQFRQKRHEQHRHYWILASGYIIFILVICSGCHNGSVEEAEKTPEPQEAASSKDNGIQYTPEPSVDDSYIPPIIDASIPPAPVTPTPAAKRVPPQKEEANASPAGDYRHNKSSAAHKSLSQLRKQYADCFIFSGKKKEKVAALTFDDAPDNIYTPQILDILKKYKVKATFFVLGSSSEEHPQMLRRIKNEGHIIGNHSYSHSLLTQLPLEGFIDEIQKTQQIVKEATGVVPVLIRPPYGDIAEEQLQWAKENGYKVVNWNADSQDWRGSSAQQVIENLSRNIRPGSILLQHAGIGKNGDLSGTVKALPQLIEKLQKDGYRLVTVPDMIGSY